MPDKLSVDLQAANLDKAVGDVNTFKTALVDTDQKINALATTTDARVTATLNNTVTKLNAVASTADAKLTQVFEKASDPNNFKFGIGFSKSVSDAVTAAEANTRKIGAAFSKTIADVERQALGLHFTLGKISDVSIGTKGVDGLGRAAERAAAEVQRTYADLRSLEALASVSREPALLKALEAEAIKAGADLDRLNAKIERVASGRAAAAERVAASGSGVDKRGLLGAAAGFGVPFANEASLAADAAAAAGIGTASLAVFGGLAAAGALIIKQSQTLREESEKRLKTEEAIAGAMNKQIIAQQDQSKAIREADAERQRSQQFQERLAAETDASAIRQQIENVKRLRDGGTGNLQQFDARISTLEGLRDDALKRGLPQVEIAFQKQIEGIKKLRDTNPAAINAKEFDQQISDLEARLRQVQQARTAAQDQAFAQNFANFQASQKQAADFERERLQRRFESVNEARAKIEDLGKTVDEVFAGLFARQGAQNPFVRVFTEADSQIQKVRESTATLSKELQAQAAAMVAVQNANDLFSTRLDSRLNALDLRTQAQDIRRTSGRNLSDQNARTAFDSINRQAATSLFDNPDFVASQIRLVQLQTKLQNAGREPTSISDRLDRQLAELQRVRPENADQQSIIDRRIIALTQGTKPEDLTSQQAEAAAKAREREAERFEQAENAARLQRAAQLATQGAIDRNIAALLAIAKSEGLTGVIRIINDAEDNARDSIGKRRRARDLDGKQFLQP